MGKLTDMFKAKEQAAPSAAPVATGMPKLTIAFDRQSIEVNGIVFTLLKSDADTKTAELKLNKMLGKDIPIHSFCVERALDIDTLFQD